MKILNDEIEISYHSSCIIDFIVGNINISGICGFHVTHNAFLLTIFRMVYVHLPPKKSKDMK